jgi:hypothetical protein
VLIVGVLAARYSDSPARTWQVARRRRNAQCFGIPDEPESCPPKMPAASTQPKAKTQHGFEEAFVSRALRDAEGRFAVEMRFFQHGKKIAANEGAVYM